MAHKKTTSRGVAKNASRALRSKSTSKTTKSLARSALSQSSGKHRGGKESASPKDARQIREEVGVAPRDRTLARSPARRSG